MKLTKYKFLIGVIIMCLLGVCLYTAKQIANNRAIFERNFWSAGTGIFTLTEPDGYTADYQTVIRLMKTGSQDDFKSAEQILLENYQETDQVNEQLYIKNLFAIIAIGQGNYMQAEASFREVMAHEGVYDNQPQLHFAAVNNLIVAWVRMGRVEESMMLRSYAKDYLGMLETHKFEEMVFQYNYLVWYSNSDDEHLYRDYVKKHYKKLIVMDTLMLGKTGMISSLSNLELGVCYMRMNQLSEAHKYFNKAQRKNASDNALIEAMICYRQGTLMLMENKANEA